MVDASILIPLVSVVIGSVIAYYGLRTSEEKKRRFELKKEAYFNFLDLLNEGVMAYATEAAIKRAKTAEELEKDENHEKNAKMILVKQILWIHEFNKALIMIDLCGSKKVIDQTHKNIHDILKKYPTDANQYLEFKSDLIDAMREDFLTKQDWQFWK